LEVSGLNGIRSIEELELRGQRLFLRLDLNVPFNSAGEISDETRIHAALPTIQYALEKGARIVLASHLGRPKKPEDRSKFSLEPVAKALSQKLNVEVQLIEEPDSDAPRALLHNMRPATMLLLENLRFAEGEEKNSSSLAEVWASYSDLYVNDAFGSSHRAHASISALPGLMKERGVGFLMKKEIEMLDQVLFCKDHPYVAVLGGAKVSDKIDLIENLIDKVDTFLIGGGMAYTFLAAQDKSIGKSMIEKDKVRFAKDLMARIDARGKKILIPVDHVCSKQFAGAPVAEPGSSIGDDLMGLDIGPATVNLFSQEIRNAKVVFWNGPMGVFEKPPYEKGTFAIAKAMSQSSGITVVGGGDSAAAINASGLSEQVTHISTGGGASLEYLQGITLPGLKALK